MHRNTKLRGVGLVLSALLLAGCANKSTKAPDSATDSAATSTSSQASKTEPPPAVAQAPVVPVVIQNPTIISFEKMSTAVDDKGKKTIAQLGDRARSSRKIVVTGFCDRRQIGNPSEAAVARAVAVRDDLIALGIAPASIVVKFDIKAANKHIAEIHFD